MVCDQQCVGVFKEKEMFIVHENDVKIKSKQNPMVTGTRSDEGDLWKILLLSANKLLENNNKLHNLWHNRNEWEDNNNNNEDNNNCRSSKINAERETS